MSIGTFIVVKNESEYVGYHIMSVLDHVDEMVFADGNSTDGTLEIIDYIKRKYDKDNKIKLFRDKDCKNLQEDYVNLFNWTLQQVKSDYAWFVHPDMICVNPETIRGACDSKGVRYSVGMESIAGESRDLKIASGRDTKWLPIFKNDYGLHYHGYYGTVEEDCYFSDFTGDKHVFWKMEKYMPYFIEDTKIQLVHYCDCKPHARRYGRMLECLKNQLSNITEESKRSIADHPRVTLKDGMYQGREYRFEKNDIVPEVFNKYKDEFECLRRR